MHYDRFGESFREARLRQKEPGDVASTLLFLLGGFRKGKRRRAEMIDVALSAFRCPGVTNRSAMPNERV